MGLTVAVTGPTGEIGISAVTALEADPGVDRVLGMARREFDPAAHGWTKTEYRQGDILDTDAVKALVSEADVVVHKTDLRRCDAGVLQLHGGLLFAAEHDDLGAFDGDGAGTALDGFEGIFDLEDVAVGGEDCG